MRWKRRRATLSAVVLGAALAALAGSGRHAEAASPDRPPFDDGLAGFVLKVKGETIPYEVFALFVLPGETIRLEIAGRKPGERFSVTDPGGQRQVLPPKGWSWKAPDAAGLRRIRVLRDGTGETIDLNVFVIVPIGRVRDGALNGYRIGAYPLKPLKGLEIYKPPRGFVEITPEVEDTAVSPHFRLGQFLCKQESGHPKYLVLKERLVLKLELILQEVNAAGYRCDTLHVMSGYRTPFYNAAIGNVKYSRHVWGGAADIFIDENPQDGSMDDLNADGSIDWRDAAVVYDLIDGLYDKARYKPYVGGLGRYEKTPAHGPFVHVDVRGFRARWGT